MWFRWVRLLVLSISVQAVSSGCIRRPVDFSDRPCPCGDGWSCDQTSNTCVRSDDVVDADAEIVIDGDVEPHADSATDGDVEPHADSDVDDGSDVDGDSDVDDDNDVDDEIDGDVEPLCDLPEQTGFNHYTLLVVNDVARYPRDGSIQFCHDFACTSNCECGAVWGQVYDGYYGGELVFDGGGDCYSSGFTLEIFLRAYWTYLDELDLPGDRLFQHGDGVLQVGDLDRTGDFYKLWQGIGLDRASSAAAFEAVGIGAQVPFEDALPGDYVNLWRRDDTGAAAIFGSWVLEESERVGIRYYSCSARGGQGCFEQDDTENLSGPAFRTELFYNEESQTGTVLVDDVLIGRVFMPDTD